MRHVPTISTFKLKKYDFYENLSISLGRKSTFRNKNIKKFHFAQNLK